jgi:hypothetical protein
VRWKQIYLSGGIDALLTHKKIGFKPSVILKEEHIKLKEKLHDNNNQIVGYNELLQKVNAEFGKQMNYTTL